MQKILCCVLYFLVVKSFATDPYPRNLSIDIQHYKFTIQLNDTTNLIDAEAEITILTKNPTSAFSFDLIEKSKYGTGMTVNSVTLNNKALKYSHQMGRLNITLGSAIKAGELLIVKINYSGIPAKGLTIGSNKFGDRTFFGDNWPDHARYWLATIDHPYDKASCEFIIIAPDHYQTIANGVLVERTNISKNQILTHWIEKSALPTKVMVIGVARFATTTAGIVHGIPVETWVYPQNEEDGFSDFKIATKVLGYFINAIGPFPYQKLANVQSTTAFGGMENASNIFYSENSVTGKNEQEGMFAHEIAHQWFGDSASELDWHHVWLSEGFATYFTNLYYEHAYGREYLVDRMNEQRQQVISYYKQNPSPVIDTTITEISEVLSTNTYQKASWVLHMLRKEVGDEAFWKGFKSYYNTYQNSNALTDDFRKIMERESGKDLKSFFDQWLWRGGHPMVSGTWTYDDRKKEVIIEIRQNQSILFNTPLEIGVWNVDGSTKTQKFQLAQKESVFTFPAQKRPKEVKLDPDSWLLFNGRLIEK